MYHVDVVSMLGDEWVAILMYDGEQCDCSLLRAKCQEHAEAEAQQLYPCAKTVNDIPVSS